MALKFGAKIEKKFEPPNISCTYLCTRQKKLAFFTLTLHPLRPLKGGLFLSFSLLFPFRFSGNQPDKSLISVIDNVCYVYPRARALCEENGL